MHFLTNQLYLAKNLDSQNYELNIWITIFVLAIVQKAHLQTFLFTHATIQNI